MNQPMNLGLRGHAATQRAGTYSAIFTSTVLASAALLLILEQLGASSETVRVAILGWPIVIYLLIAAINTTRTPAAFFVAGHRVPAFYNGIVLAVSALGASGLFTMAGLFFLIGFDALSIGIGISLGVMLMAALIAPYFRKCGAYTVPSYFSQRFQSRVLRLVAAVALAAPMLMLLVAELRLGSMVLADATGLSPQVVMISGLALVLVTTVLGGVGGASWTAVAQGIVVLIGLSVPLVVLGLYMTNIPLPQITYGPLLSNLDRLEAVSNLASLPLPNFAAPLSFPGTGPELITRPFAAMFASVDAGNFVLVILITMMGVAALPSVVSRAATPPSVYETRKSFAWMAFLVGFILLSLPAAAVLLRHMLMTDLVGQPLANVPAWFTSMVDMGIADFDRTATRLTLENVTFHRDTILLAMPIAAGLPGSLSDLMLAAAMAAALAAVTARIVTLGNSLSEDLIFGLSDQLAPTPLRMLSARIVMAVVAMLAAWVALSSQTDPLRLIGWGLSLAAATAFPVLVMSVWWKRINVAGALAGVSFGFGLTVLHILLAETLGGGSLFGISSLISGAVGVPFGLIAAVAGSLLSAPPEARDIEFVRDMRIPGGETMFDRELRLARVGTTRPS